MRYRKLAFEISSLDDGKWLRVRAVKLGMYK